MNKFQILKDGLSVNKISKIFGKKWNWSWKPNLADALSIYHPSENDKASSSIS